MGPPAVDGEEASGGSVGGATTTSADSGLLACPNGGGRMTKVWHVERLFASSGAQEMVRRFAVVVLNSEICARKRALVFNLWKRGLFKVAVDGGIDRIWDLVRKMTSSNTSLMNLLIPDLVTGDFDSASPDLLESLEKRGSIVIPTPDQDETDFTKCLRILHERGQEKTPSFPTVDAIVAVGSCGTRLDHCVGVINTLHKKESGCLLPDVDLFLLLDEDVCWILNPGHHEIAVPSSIRGGTCALVPFARPAVAVTTTGLKWNLQSQKLEFGALVSTSNAFTEAGIVTVECTDPLLWIMSLNDTVLQDLE